MDWVEKGGLGGLPWWCCVQGSCMVPCFCSWHLRNGTWPFCILLFIIVPAMRACSFLQSLIISLHSVALGAVCPGLLTLQ